VSDGNGGTDTQSIDVVVTNVNESPTVTSLAAANVVENQTAVLTVTSADVDGASPAYSITGGADAALFSIDNVSGDLTFAVARDLTFAVAPDFENPADANGDNVYDVTVQVADGNGGTDTQAIVVTINDANDSPIISSVATASVVENQTAAVTVTSADIDGGAPTYAIVGGVDRAFFSINSVSGELSFNSAPDFESPSDTDGNNVYEVIVEVSDGNGGIDTQSIAVTVTGINEDPILTSVAAVNVAENQISVLALESVDVDGGAPVYSIVGGVDAALFSVDSVTGALTFNSDQDFENPNDLDSDNIYEVFVQVSDGNGGTDTQTIAVTVTDINEAPVINSGGALVTGNGSIFNFSVDENQDSEFLVVATDEDAGSVLTYALTGGADQSRFTINPSTGEITFVTQPDHEEQESFEIELTVTDSDGLASVKTIVINVQDVNESPTALSDTLAASENEVLVIDTVNSIISNDSDPEQDVLTLVDFTQPENGTLTINAQGNLEYEPNIGFVGQDSFDYIVEDAGGLQVTAQVFLDVRQLSDPILASALPMINEFDEVSATPPEPMQTTQPNMAITVVTKRWLKIL